jgi:hypothetical protein
MGPTTSAATGPRLTEELRESILDVLDRVRYGTLTIQSDWARSNGTAVAAAASLGLISTETPEGFGRIWRLTAAGFAFHEEAF